MMEFDERLHGTNFNLTAHYHGSVQVRSVGKGLITLCLLCLTLQVQRTLHFHFEKTDISFETSEIDFDEEIIDEIEDQIESSSHFQSGQIFGDLEVVHICLCAEERRKKSSSHKIDCCQCTPSLWSTTVSDSL